MTMKIGMLAVVNEYSVDPAALARNAEALGFESLWLSDHPVMPVHTTTPLPEMPPGKGEIRDYYSRMCDPFVAMAMAAAVTTRLKVATGVWLVPERNPLVTANEIATLGHVSDGRVLIGSKDKNALRWVAQWGDGWCPILLSPDQMKSELSKLRVECTKAGRDYS